MDHDAADAAAGGSRIHYAPGLERMWVTFNDIPVPDATSPRWEAEVLDVSATGETAGEVAAALRLRAAEIIAAAVWLEARA